MGSPDEQAVICAGKGVFTITLHRTRFHVLSHRGNQVVQPMFVEASLTSSFALAALVGAVLLSTERRWNLLLGVGCLLGLGVAFYAYLSAPMESEYLKDGCQACGKYLGRWWQPGLVALLVGLGYIAWILGLAVGGTIRSVLRPTLAGRASLGGIVFRRHDAASGSRATMRQASATGARAADTTRLALPLPAGPSRADPWSPAQRARAAPPQGSRPEPR